MISRARFSFRPRLRFCPARESGPSDCWLSRKNSIAGCCSTAFNMSPNRPSTWGRIASRSNEPAHIRASPPLLAEMQKWLDQNATSRSDEPAFGERRALQSRQRLGAKGLLDDVERLLRRFRRVGLHRGIGRHRLGRRHRRARAVICRRLHRQFFRRDILGDAGERRVAPRRLRVGRALRRRALGRRRRRARFRRGIARLLRFKLIFKHRFGQRRRRLQSGHFEQHAVGTDQFGRDEAARIGRRVDEIAGRPAARTEPEAIERDKGVLRIAGHRLLPLGFPFALRSCGRGIFRGPIILPFEMNPT